VTELHCIEYKYWVILIHYMYLL